MYPGRICRVATGVTMALFCSQLAHAQSRVEQESNRSPSATDMSEQNGTGSKSAGQVVTVFQDRGILTSKGRFVIEPALSYAHSSSTIVAIEGFTVIPALVVGLINVSESQRDIFNESISLRYGITSHLEVGVKVPYLQVQESIRERAAFEGTPVDIVSDSSGEGLGDVEMSLNYQLNDGLDGAPYFVTNLRVKSDTGISPFKIKTKQLANDQGDVVGTIFEEQPTGTGFWSVQGGLSVMYPSDPAVLYSSMSYLWNIKDDKGAEFGGVIDPGDAVGLSFGIGFSVNERTSFSLGYDHTVLFETTTEAGNSAIEAIFKRTHSGSLLLGISQGINRNSSLNLSLGVGVTEASPDMQLTVRMPFAF